MDPRTRILVVGDSHIRRLRDFVETPPDEFHGSVQLSMGLEDSSRLDLSFLGYGGRTVSRIRSDDMQEFQRFFPHVVGLMVGVNDLTSPTASAHGVASDIHKLALSIAAVESCVKVLVGAIPPRLSYPATAPAYPKWVEHCNYVLRNLLEVEESISYFKIRGLINPVREIHIRDGVHFKPHGMYQIYCTVRDAVFSGLTIMDRWRGGKPPAPTVTLVSKNLFFPYNFLLYIFLSIKFA